MSELATWKNREEANLHNTCRFALSLFYSAFRLLCWRMPERNKARALINPNDVIFGNEDVF